jgi:hypothetical protein
VLKERPDVALFEADGSHPTPAGSYLAACTFAERLLDVRVRGHGMSDRLKLDREVASYLQSTAARIADGALTPGPSPASGGGE